MQLNFSWIFHPDWRYALLLIELLIVLALTQTVLSVDARLAKDVLVLDAMFLLPLIIGLPAHALLKRKGSRRAETIFNAAIILEFLAVMYMLALFSVLF